LLDRALRVGAKHDPLVLEAQLSQEAAALAPVGLDVRSGRYVLPDEAAERGAAELRHAAAQLSAARSTPSPPLGGEGEEEPMRPQAPSPQLSPWKEKGTEQDGSRAFSRSAVIADPG
jgi:hypothetical protein